ncbi:30S ribosomal protein S9 [Candidatus Microgenomates bacterium]|nr:30S ribosomal protein S9 [Candidatus Microgenomates bacterium]
MAKKDTKVVATTEISSEVVKDASFYFAVGRRKTAVARARVYPSSAEVSVGGKKLEKGETYVNGMPIEQYFKSPYAKAQYSELFRTTNTAGRFIITVVVNGSGESGQLGATTLAIARSLVQVDPKFRAILRKKDYMTRDPRGKERKKAGLPGARKKKSSPKR